MPQKREKNATVCSVRKLKKEGEKAPLASISDDHDDDAGGEDDS